LHDNYILWLVLAYLTIKVIAVIGMWKLRVKYNIRKLTGIDIQKTLH
jgi:hypothetical protein